MTETHLSNDEICCLPGYYWEGFNRKFKHKNSRITHCGIGMFFKQSMYNTYNISVVDRTFDGIMCLKFNNKNTDFSMLINCLLPAPGELTMGQGKL